MGYKHLERHTRKEKQDPYKCGAHTPTTILTGDLCFGQAKIFAPPIVTISRVRYIVVHACTSPQDRLRSFLAWGCMPLATLPISIH